MPTKGSTTAKSSACLRMFWVLHGEMCTSKVFFCSGWLRRSSVSFLIILRMRGMPTVRGPPVLGGSGWWCPRCLHCPTILLTVLSLMWTFLANNNSVFYRQKTSLKRMVERLLGDRMFYCLYRNKTHCNVMHSIFKRQSTPRNKYQKIAEHTL